MIWFRGSGNGEIAVRLIAKIPNADFSIGHVIMTQVRNRIGRQLIHGTGSYHRQNGREAFSFSTILCLVKDSCIFASAYFIGSHRWFIHAITIKSCTGAAIACRQLYRITLNRWLFPEHGIDSCFFCICKDITRDRYTCLIILCRLCTCFHNNGFCGSDSDIRFCERIVLNLDFFIFRIIQLAPFTGKIVDRLIDGLQPDIHTVFQTGPVRSPHKRTTGDCHILRPLNPDITSTFFIFEADSLDGQARSMTGIHRCSSAYLAHIDGYGAGTLNTDILGSRILAHRLFCLRFLFRNCLEHKFRRFEFLRACGRCLLQFDTIFTFNFYIGGHIQCSRNRIGAFFQL